MGHRVITKTLKRSEFPRLLQRVGGGRGFAQARGLSQSPANLRGVKNREVPIILAVVVVVSLLIPYLSKKEAEKQSPRWSIEGVSPQSSLEENKELLGDPISDSLEDGIRRTVYSGTWGKVTRTEFIEEATVGISGKVLEKNGMAFMEEHFTHGKVIGMMGEPELIRNPDDDTASYQYDGVRIYLREQRVTSFVIEDSLENR